MGNSMSMAKRDEFKKRKNEMHQNPTRTLKTKQVQLSERRKNWRKRLGSFHAKAIPCANTITCHRITSCHEASTLHPNPIRTPKIKPVQLSELRKNWRKRLGPFHFKAIPCANANTCHVSSHPTIKHTTSQSDTHTKD